MDTYYAALSERSVQDSGVPSVNSGVSAHQRASLDPMLRYYPRLPPSNLDYIPRADGSPVPALELVMGGVARMRPGDKDDKMEMQLIKADVQYFLQGVYITPPSRTSKVSQSWPCWLGCVCLASVIGLCAT